VLNVHGDLIPKNSQNLVSMNLAIGPRNVGFVLFSDPSFDATQIDLASVRVGRTGIALERDGSFNAWFVDHNGDGRLDAFLFFSRAELFANGDLTLASTTFTVTGASAGFNLFTSSDAVQVIP
jgi:hypothetical protein